MQLIAVVFFVLFSCVVWAQQNVAPSVLVTTVAVEQGELGATQEYVGNVQYYAVSKLPAERAGKVDFVSSDPADKVKKGDVLLRLNTDVLNYTVAASSAKLEQQKHNLDKTLRDYERSKQLLKDNATSVQKYQDAETAYFVQQGLFTSAQADLNVLKEELRRSVVTAPFDGVILKRYVNIGEWVGVGVAVYDLASSRMEVEVNVPQSIITYVTPGAVVAIKIEGANYAGKIRAIVPQGNVVSRTFPVKVDIADIPKIISGMDASVSIPNGKTVTAMLVPRDAVVKRNNQDVIFTVVDEKAVMVPVKVLGEKGVQYGVLSPLLKVADDVITRGNENIRQGQAVSINNAVSTPVVQ